MVKTAMHGSYLKLSHRSERISPWAEYIPAIHGVQRLAAAQMELSDSNYTLCPGNLATEQHTYVPTSLKDRGVTVFLKTEIETL